MKSHWRKMVALLPLTLEKKIYQRYFQKEHNEWLLKTEKGLQSHLTKQQLLKSHASDHNLKTLIETGTYLGDMVFAMQDQFDRIISIELSEHFYKKAKARFQAYKNVEIMQGDSGTVLRTIVPKLAEPVLFWLDGHYSGGITAKGEKECPIYEEMASILASSYKHLLLIDDARLFTGENDYPTIDELKNYTFNIRPGSSFTVSGDVIIIKIN